jgi:predicted chitinase
MATDPLASIFTFLRPHLKEGWNPPGLIAGFKAELAKLGVQITPDGAGVAGAAAETGTAAPAAPTATAPTAPAAPGPSKLANPAAFFDAIRPSSRFRTLADEKRISIELDIAAMSARDFPIAYAAYVLATEYHETGARMTAAVESLNYSVEGLMRTFGRHRISEADARRYGRSGTRAANQEAIANTIYGGDWGVENLGNTEPGDGWRFRGRGKDQCTGRANYGKVDSALGLDGALLANPDLLLEERYASEAIVTGMLLGRYTGKKLAHFLPSDRPASQQEFRVSRPIINRMDKADEVAGHAIFFQSALQRGGYSA